MQNKKLYLLDTCIYGVLVDRKHKEYRTVKAILDYAKNHREQFVTTFIVYRELTNMKPEHQDIVLPEYYLTLSGIVPSLEVVFVKTIFYAEKLSWRYIQKLKIKSAKKVFYDALNYALASYAEIDSFVTLNRKDILANEFQPTVMRINEEMRVKYVEIKTPNQFLAPLI